MIKSLIQNTIKHNQFKDFSWHLGGTLIPILLNFIRNPIFTRHFTPEEFGYYSLVFLTFNYCSLTLFSWLSSNIWRYYYEYKEKGELKKLFSNISGLYFAGAIVLTAITFFWYRSAELFLVKKLILFSFLFYVLNDITSLYLVMIRLEKRVKEYNLIQSVRAITNFTLLCLLAFIVKMRIEAMALSFFIATAALVFYIYIKSQKEFRFFLPSLKLISLSNSKVFLTYGMVGLVTNLTILLLNNSDRYFIALFHSIAEVGIYNQNYAIAYTSILALSTAFMNTVNPTLNKVLTQNYNQSVSTVARYMFIYLLAIVPATFILAYFTKTFNHILLGESFREGYGILSYVAISLFLFGFSAFSGTRLKFGNRFKVVIFSYVAACIVNITLNYFLLQKYDYAWAAITTLIAFITLYLLIAIYDKEVSVYFIKQYRNALVMIFVCLALLIVINVLLTQHTNIGGLLSGSIFVVIINAIVLYGLSYVLYKRYIVE